MTWFFTPHCRDRAEERYGLKLTVKELSAMLIACQNGTAPVLRKRVDGGDTFCFEVRGIKTFPIISPEGVIITFAPSNFMVAAEGRRHRKEMANQHPRAPRPGFINRQHTHREPYHRPAFKREALTEVKGE